MTTFEQAKQQIAENTFLKTKTWDSIIENISGADLKYCIDQAAELWQAENLKEIERLRAANDELTLFRQQEANKNADLQQRIAELETAIKKITKCVRDDENCSQDTYSMVMKAYKLTIEKL